jgi:hypothetical protein
MGRTMAIVTYKWRGFVLGTYTDPIKLGILRALDIKIGGLCLRTVSTCFLTKLLGMGSTTFDSRIQQFLHTDTLSPGSR